MSKLEKHSIFSLLHLVHFYFAYLMSTKEVRMQVLVLSPSPLPLPPPPPPFQRSWLKLGLERNIFEHALSNKLFWLFFTMLQTLFSWLLLLNNFLSIYPLPLFSTFLYEFYMNFLKYWLFGTDPNRIGLLGKPPAVKHSFPSKSR